MGKLTKKNIRMRRKRIQLRKLKKQRQKELQNFNCPLLIPSDSSEEEDNLLLRWKSIQNGRTVIHVYPIGSFPIDIIDRAHALSVLEIQKNEQDRYLLELGFVNPKKRIIFDRRTIV